MMNSSNWSKKSKIPRKVRNNLKNRKSCIKPGKLCQCLWQKNVKKMKKLNENRKRLDVVLRNKRPKRGLRRKPFRKRRPKRRKKPGKKQKKKPNTKSISNGNKPRNKEKSRLKF